MRGRISRNGQQRSSISCIVYNYSTKIWSYHGGTFTLSNLLQGKSFQHLLSAQVRDRGTYFINKCTLLLLRNESHLKKKKKKKPPRKTMHQDKFFKSLFSLKKKTVLLEWKPSISLSFNSCHPSCRKLNGSWNWKDLLSCSSSEESNQHITFCRGGMSK